MDRPLWARQGDAIDRLFQLVYGRLPGLGDAPGTTEGQITLLTDAARLITRLLPDPEISNELRTQEGSETECPLYIVERLETVTDTVTGCDANLIWVPETLFFTKQAATEYTGRCKNEKPSRRIRVDNTGSNWQLRRVIQWLRRAVTDKEEQDGGTSDQQ